MSFISLDPAAVAEIRDAADWYAERRSGLGDRFLDEVESVLAFVAERPGSYPSLAEPKEPVVRRALLPGFPYAVVFLTMADETRVLAVAHARRQPGYWLQRLR